METVDKGDGDSHIGETVTREPSDEACYEIGSIALIERDLNVTLPYRAVVSLVSYALAGPTNEASAASRDHAIEVTRRCVIERVRELIEELRASGGNG